MYYLLTKNDLSSKKHTKYIIDPLMDASPLSGLELPDRSSCEWYGCNAITIGGFTGLFCSLALGAYFFPELQAQEMQRNLLTSTAGIIIIPTTILTCHLLGELMEHIADRFCANNRIAPCKQKHHCHGETASYHCR